MAQFGLSLPLLTLNMSTVLHAAEHGNRLKTEADVIVCESSGFQITVAEINLAVSPALTFNEH